MGGFKKFLSKLRRRRKDRKVKGANISADTPNTVSVASPSRIVPTLTPNAFSAASPSRYVPTLTPNAFPAASAGRDVSTPTLNTASSTIPGRNISPMDDNISESSSEGDDASIDSTWGTEVNIFATDTRGQTALHRAAQCNKSIAALQLLSRGANISAVDTRGRTALHVAAARGHVDCAQILVNSGASLKARVTTRLREGGGNLTLVSMARWYGHRDVVNVIRRHVGLPEVAEGVPLTYGFSRRSYYGSGRRAEYEYGVSSGWLWPDYTVRDFRRGEQEVLTPTDARYWD